MESIPGRGMTMWTHDTGRSTDVSGSNSRWEQMTCEVRPKLQQSGEGTWKRVRQHLVHFHSLSTQHPGEVCLLFVWRLGLSMMPRLAFNSKAHALLCRFSRVAGVTSLCLHTWFQEKF